MGTLTLKLQGNGRRSSELEQMIREAITRGDLKPGQRLGSAKQLAKYWNASYGAVRQSLETLAAKGIVERRPRAGTFVSSDTEPSSVRDDSANIIGLLVPDIRVPEYSAVARHLQDAGHKAHFEVLVSSTDNERERYDQSIQRHLQAGVGGLVLIAPQQARVSLETLLELQKSGIPVVNYARTMDVVPWPTVQTDVMQSAFLPVQHVCSLGRKRIGFLSYPASDIHQTQMLYGLYRAAAEAGLSSSSIVEYQPDDAPYLARWTDRRALELELNNWLDEHRDLDAICCMHDHIGVSVLSVLQKRGVRVPDDIAVTSHGNMSEMFGVPQDELTNVDTCISKAAEEMVRLLQLGTVSEEQKLPPVVAIQPRLLVGQSTVGQRENASPDQGV
jgi:DNA-binding LacI/PurR family transcriptional regulator